MAYKTEDPYNLKNLEKFKLLKRIKNFHIKDSTDNEISINPFGNYWC